MGYRGYVDETWEMPLAVSLPFPFVPFVPFFLSFFCSSFCVPSFSLPSFLLPLVFSSCLASPRQPLSHLLSERAAVGTGQSGAGAERYLWRAGGGCAPWRKA